MIWGEKFSETIDTVIENKKINFPFLDFEPPHTKEGDVIYMFTSSNRTILPIPSSQRLWRSFDK